MIKPIGQKVLIEKIEKANTTASGIILTSANEEKEKVGAIITLGTGTRLPDGTRMNFDVKVGDKVLFEEYRAKEIKHEGKEYYLLNEDEILVVIE